MAVIQFGPVVRVDSNYYQSSQYAELYQNLARMFSGVTITAGYLLPEEPGAPLSNEVSLSASGIGMRTFRGNASTTGLFSFIGNYLRAFPVVVRSILEARKVLIFGPCLIGALAMWTCKLTRKPFGFYWANDWETENNFRPVGKSWRALTNMVSARLVQTLTDRAARDAAFVLTPSHKLHTELLGRSLSAYTPIPLIKIREALSGPREACSADRGGITLLYVGELRQAKGLEVLVEAFIRIRSRDEVIGRDIRLRFVGDGEMREQLAALVHEGGREADVTFCGHISDGTLLAREYLQASMFVLPSQSEGFPRVLYEAMATGLPIIATRVGGIPYLLKDGRDALLTPPGDAEAIVESVLRLTDDPNLYHQLSRNGLRLFGALVRDRIGREGSLAVQISTLFGASRA